MKMKRRLLLFAVPFVGALAVLGCTESGVDEGASGGESASKPRVALIMKSLANEFFKTMEDGAQAYHSENSDRFSLIANGIKNETDVSGQVTIVEQMIAQQVDALVIAPANSQALVPVLKRAAEAGIVVVNIDNKLDEEAMKAAGVVLPFIGPDDRGGARLAGEYLAKSLQAGDEVAIIEGAPGAFNAIQRRMGFEEAMAEMTIVSQQTGNWEMAKANQVAAGILNEYPELSAILCANDSMALGVVAAVREAGREGDVLIVGYDNISAVNALVKEGKMVCTVDQHGAELAVFGIEYALEILGSGVAPENRLTPVDLVTADTIAQSSSE